MKKAIVYGSIIGDIAGSTVEGTYPEGTWEDIDLEDLLKIGHFTDDTVLTIANLDAIESAINFKEAYKKWGNYYKTAGFSKNFIEKFLNDSEQSHSSANGALMMLSPFIALESDDWGKAVHVTHDSIEAYRCADWYVNYGRALKNGKILSETKAPYFPFLTSYDQLTKERHWDMSSLITLRNAAVCFNSSKSYTEAVQRALFLGGDTDTTAAIVGAWAAVKFGVPDSLIQLADKKLTGEMVDFLN